MRKPNPVVGDDKVDLAKEKPHAKDKIASGRQSARALYVAVHLGYQKLTLEVRALRWSRADWREQGGRLGFHWLSLHYDSVHPEKGSRPFSAVP